MLHNRNIKTTKTHQNSQESMVFYYYLIIKILVGK